MKTWRILLVDDDPKYRRLLKAHFERAGHEVLEAGEGEPGFALAEAEQPQVVLLDFDLPDVVGTTICRRLKAHPRTSSIPIAIVTGHADEETRFAAREAGADDYVLKPFSFGELLVRIRFLVEGVPSVAASASGLR
jgi:DNA-binding response OmpR family regulator